MEADYILDSDLTLYLSKEDIQELGSDTGGILSTEDKDGYRFWLWKDSSIEEEIKVTLPHNHPKDAWLIVIADEAYQRLLRLKEIGTRLALHNSPKLRIRHGKPEDFFNAYM